MRAPLLRRLAPLLCVAASWLVGCGDAPGVDPKILVQQLDNPDKGLVEEAVRDLARQGARAPERVVPLLIDRLVALHQASATIAARVSPQVEIPDLEARNQAVIRLMGLMRQRLTQGGFTVEQLRQEGGSLDVFLVPPADVGLTSFVREQLRLELTRAGVFELRAEIPPPFAPTPERPRSPWREDTAAYAAWFAAEQALLDAAGGDPARYVPTRKEVALVPVLDVPEAQGARAVPLVRDDATLPVLSELDVIPGLRDDPSTGVPSLYLVPQPGAEARVRAALEANAGLRLWLVGDGRAIAVARVPGRPGSALTFPMHGATPTEARTRASKLAARMGAGRLPFAVKVDDLPSTVQIDPSHPVCRALVRTGPAAEPALDSLVARDAAFAPLVKQLREGILQVRTE